MEDELKSLELARSISSSSSIQKPEAIIGFIPDGQEVSFERCRLSGMQHTINQKPRPQVIREAILDVLSAHG